MEQQRLWTRSFVLAFAVNLSMSLTFYLLMTSMAGYAIDRFGAAETVAGLASSGFIIGALVARVFAGKYLDFIGRRRMILGALIVFVVCGLLYIPLAEVWAVIAVRVVHGIAFGAGNTAIMAAVQTVIPPARRAEGTGYFGTSTTLATAIGPFLAVLLAQQFGYAAMFLACALFSVAGCVLALGLRLPERTPSEEERADKWRLTLTSIIDLGALRIAAVMLLTGMAYSIVLAFLAGHAAGIGTPEAASGFFLLFALVMLVARLVVGRIQDRYGDDVVMYPIFALFTLGLVLIALADAGWMIVLAAVPMGLGFGSLFPSAQAIAVNVTAPHRVGLAISTFFIMLDLGTGLGPVLLGALVPGLGLSGVYLVCAGLVVAAAGVYFVFHGRHRGGRPTALT
ncbi:MFS transporter [Brevibacterium ihuae]|uniref:MFS transporter n=1 Tax=Brevibacterium ihuae TaxID=1631743 RepID=UPI000C77139F|nr:MFS transporter [Brevibacterium ihuae]